MNISVIVLTYNNPFFLKKVIDGYLNQYEFPHELIIADDGSGPETQELIADYSKNAPFPIIHSYNERTLDKPRLSLTRNKAVHSSSGDYLIFSDGDCIPGPYLIYDHRNLAQKGWFVSGKRNYLSFDSNQHFSGNESTWQQLKLWYRGGLSKLRLTFRVPGLWKEKKDHIGVRGCNIAVHRADFYRINGWNQDFIGYFGEDSEFVLRLMRSGVRRKEALWSAFFYHLEHTSISQPEDMKRNQELLNQAEFEPVFTPNGISTLGEKAHFQQLIPLNSSQQDQAQQKKYQIA